MFEDKVDWKRSLFPSVLFPDLEVLQVEFNSFINGFSNDMGDSTTGIFNDF